MIEWRKSLSFSDRLSQTSKMQVSTQQSLCTVVIAIQTNDTLSAAAYKEANPECEAVEASRYAKASEEAARKGALNINEYNDLCTKAATLVVSSMPVDQINDEHPDDHIFPNLPNTGARIGRYSGAHHHNDGLFSEVFSATHPDYQPGANVPKIVALKITTPEVMTAPHDSVREARILEAAKGSNIITLLETFQQAGGRFILVFPFMPHDLNALLHQRRLTDSSRRRILRDVFTGVAHLHGIGIIHRDIKPSNILLASPVGPAYLADFGIAWSPSDKASEPADNKILDVGTTCYRPPELLFGHSAYGPELDLWAVGCLAAQVVCLDGTTLFDAGDLGSELALIRSVFQTLGTPDLDVWPEAARLPDWGKMHFTRYPGKAWLEILPGCGDDDAALDLVRRLVVFESRRRLRAAEALEHPYIRAI